MAKLLDILQGPLMSWMSQKLLQKRQKRSSIEEKTHLSCDRKTMYFYQQTCILLVVSLCIILIQKKSLSSVYFILMTKECFQILLWLIVQYSIWGQNLIKYKILEKKTFIPLSLSPASNVDWMDVVLRLFNMNAHTQT